MTWKLNIYGIRSQMFIFFAFFQLYCNSEQCHELPTPGITIPDGDILIENGTALTILCKLHDDYMKNNSQINSNNITFYRNEVVVSPEWVTIENNSTVRLHVENLPPSTAIYTCKVKEKEEEKPICLNSVSVGTKPTKVHNFTCISYNYENLTCTWIAPEHYVKTTYNLSYHFQGRSSRMTYPCPKMTHVKNMYSCFWDVTTRPHYRQVQQIYYFNLFMLNKFGNESQKDTFQHFAHVIPAPPENLTVINRTSNSVTLSWSVNSPMNNFPPGVYYRVLYQSEFDSKDEWHVSNTTSIDKHNFNPVYNLTGLKYAHVLYDIRVSMRSTKASELDEKMWSKNVSVTVRTTSLVPGAPPRVDIGSFEVISNRTNRDVYVYWQYIAEQEKNGENFSYKVEGIEEITDKKISATEITSSYAKFTAVSFGRHKFTILSSNEVGHSANKSTVFLPAFLNRVPEPISFTKISYGNQIYELSWIAPTAKTEEEITNYTIFYCRNDYDRPFQCKGYLDWVVVPSNTTIKNVTVPEDKIYQFAISANTRTGSSGMVWATCTVIQGFTKIKSLWIDHIGSDFIEVSWKLDCSDRIGSIDGFIIYYCPIVSPVASTCKEPEKNKTLIGDPTITRGKLENLKPYTTYMLAVSVRSKHNNGLPSESLYNTTLEAAPGPPANITVFNITSTSMIVQWSPPKAMNGVLRYYEVEYSHNGGNVRRKRPDPETSERLELKNLYSYTEYNITVYAHTVHTSQPVTKTVKTAISVPGKMNSPNIKFQNESVILIGWDPPAEPGGPLNLYELQIKEKINSDNNTHTVNTSELQREIQNCASDKNFKVLYFSVRAINIDKANNKPYFGEWSPEMEYNCRSSSRFIYWIVAVIGIFGLGIAFIALRKLWYHCKKMRDVEVKLPPGLNPQIVNDLGMTHWPQMPKSSDDVHPHKGLDTSADEELLLTKKSECSESHDRIVSGDSSGCSSGHESVTSSLASGTNLSSTSDSGTEQPRTPSSESMSRENSLRQRRPGSETFGWDNEIAWPNPKGGYVTTLPVTEKSSTPSSNWLSSAVPASNYCVLGVDTTVPSNDPISAGYVPVPISISHNEQPSHHHQPKNPSYVTCDSLFISKLTDEPSQVTSPPYVKSSDALLMSKMLQHTETPEPQGHTDDTKYSVLPSKVRERTDVSSPYVMAADENLAKTKPYVTLTGKLINIEPVADTAIDTYKQQMIDTDIINTGTDNSAKNAGKIMSEGTEDYLNDNADLSLNSYCRLGLDRAAPTSTSAPFSILDSGASVNAAAAAAAQRKSTTPSVVSVSDIETPTKGYVPHRQFENKSLKED